MSLSPPPIDPQFERKRKEWISCIGGDDRNCVRYQVYDIIWNAGVYRAVLEARRIADRDASGSIKLNGLVHQLLDRCFVQSQLVSVRRLMDGNSLYGSKAVYSLKSLIKDMKDNRHLFTRQNLFAAFGEVMNADALRAARQDSHALKGLKSGWETGPDEHGCEQLHKTIDALCNVATASRNPNDVVAESVFTKLVAQLAETERICIHVNSFVAHAATPESRAEANADQANITFADLWRAHEIVCRTFQFVDTYLLRQTCHAFLAIAADDLFRHIDIPLVASERVPLLREAWERYAQETRRWEEGTLPWILGSDASC